MIFVSFFSKIIANEQFFSNFVYQLIISKKIIQKFVNSNLLPIFAMDFEFNLSRNLL